jgi:pectate lyase
MAVTRYRYNHTSKLLLDLSMADEASNFYVMLVDGTTAFDATHTTLDLATDSGADEVSGNGWTVGGENLANVDVTTVDTDDAMLDADNIVVTAVGGNIAATDAIVYVDVGGLGTTKYPLWFLDFGETKTATTGNEFKVEWSASGITRGVYT